MHSSKFGQTGSCDLLICDEAHRLKNDQTLTNKVACTYVLSSYPTKFVQWYFLYLVFSDFDCNIWMQALASLTCKRRVLLSGTPMQVMKNFTDFFMFCVLPFFLILQHPNVPEWLGRVFCHGQLYKSRKFRRCFAFSPLFWGDIQ